MSAKESATSPTHLSVDDFEAALSLLSSEASLKKLNRRQAAITTIADIATFVLLSSALQGLITLFFRVTWGLIALGLAVVALIVTGAAASSPDHVPDITRRLRRTIAGTKIDQAAGIGWTRRDASRPIGIFGGVFVLIYFLTIIALIYGVITQSGSTVFTSLVTGLVLAVIIGVCFAIDEYQEFEYFSLVSKLQEDFKSRLSDVGTEKTVAISSREIELLSQIEKQNVDRNVARALENWGDEASAFYSIALSPLALEHLRELPEDVRYKIREAIDSLQITPRPQNARLAGFDQDNAEPKAPTQYQLRFGDARVTYAVDDERRRVDVIDILTHEGGVDAS